MKPDQINLPFNDGPGFAAIPKRRRKIPQRSKRWRISPEALEILRTMKAREKARQESQHG